MALILVIVSFGACGVSGDDEKSNSRPQLTDFEREIKSLKIADFDYIFVFTRRDGAKHTAEDKRFIKEMSHPFTNRFTQSEDETMVFAGSNFEFDDGNLAALKDRFEVLDFSKPKEVLQKKKRDLEAESNAASNSSNTR